MHPSTSLLAYGTSAVLYHHHTTSHCCVLQVGGKAFMISHFEAPLPSTAYISELAADKGGKLKITSTSPIDDTNAR